MWLPETRAKLTARALKIAEDCRVSQGLRAAQARTLRQWRTMGSNDGQTAIYNKIGQHIQRLGSYLYSSADMRFHVDFENLYPREVLQQADTAGRILTREWERKDVDVQFGQGVEDALTYGCVIPKALWFGGGLATRLVMPWCFGVYREDLPDLKKQEAVCESTYITTHELWRRIQHLPDAAKMFQRAVSYARRNTSGDTQDSLVNNVILSGSIAPIQTGIPLTNTPGGFVDLSQEGNALLTPTVAPGLIGFHELWVWDDARNDYTTIQIAEPDILICPLYKRINLFVEGSQALPYGQIQPNRLTSSFWGMSEIQALMKLQAMLRDGLIDIKKLLSVQFDRILAFKGYGMNDERYDAFRRAGWIASDEPQGEVKDLTPQMPGDAFKYIDDIIRFFDESAGFQPILTGQGEQGVRAGNHAQTLMRSASPHLRGRALITERQLADFADRTFQLLAAKDDRAYWTTAPSDDEAEDKQHEASQFTLGSLPDDYRVVVDSHSSSPIYQADNMQTALMLAKAGVVDGESLIDLSSIPLKDLLKERYRQKQKAQQKMFAEHPEMFLAQMQKAKKPANAA